MYYKKNILYRFDFIIKYLYVYSYEKNLQTNFFKDLYTSHIRCINNYTEETEYHNKKIIKSNSDICINIFNKIIKSIKDNGFDHNYPIPIGNNNLIINGMHRLVTTYFYKINPIFIKQPRNGSFNYTYDFFLNRNIREPLCNAGIPLTISYCDTVALEQINHNNNIRTMILFPISYKDNDINIQNIIKQYGYIYYKKQIQLNKLGLTNLIKECYRNESWIGGEFPTNILANNKTNYCYNDSYTTIYLINFYDTNKIINMKQECRCLFNIGKHSLHITDYITDTYRVASSLLNKNSIDFLNNANTDNISKNLKKNFSNYCKNIINNRNDFCVTSSAVLDIYGLRESNDLDYLHYSDLNINISNISPHKDKWLSYYHVHKHDIIYNPENYFYFNGFKFASLNCIGKMKENRNEKKDINDLILINDKI